MQEKKSVIFRFSFEDKIEDFKVSSNVFSEKMYIIELIINTFDNILQKHKNYDNNQFSIDNKFIFSNSIEIYTHDKSGNSIKLNLIDLFFDNTELHNGNVSLNNEYEPCLYTEIQNVFFDLPKKIREIITLTHIIFNLTNKYIILIENVKEITDKYRIVLKFLFKSFSMCQSRYNENYLKTNKDYISLYMNNKKSIFIDMKRHLENRLKQIIVSHSIIANILSLDENKPVSIQDKGETKKGEKLELDLQEVYLKLTESVKLNSNAVFQVLRELYNLIDNK